MIVILTDSIIESPLPYEKEANNMATKKMQEYYTLKKILEKKLSFLKGAVCLVVQDKVKWLESWHPNKYLILIDLMS